MRQNIKTDLQNFCIGEAVLDPVRWMLGLVSWQLWKQ